MTILQADKLSADLQMNAVQLKVGDMKAMSGYYQQALGLEVLGESAQGTRLGRGTQTLVNLQHAPGLQLPAAGEAGLFHTALLFETQADLAATVLSAAQFDQSRFVGSSDHLVSEAFYFTDPEGNGIELYWDRPREAWSWSDGQVAMDTVHLDPNAFLSSHLSEQAIAAQRTAEAEIGHVHLQVGDVATARAFYVNTLGFDETTSLGNQALFVSAGGYHHHMAMNVWNSRGAGPRKDTLGLGEVLINVPTEEEVGKLAERLSFAKVENHHTGAELRFMDPWNNQLRVAVG
ncbi:glyoxalase [Arthrobacter sp. MYb211]|uniref:VOC family protein n=1 Tax=unclassified Arthrobacter TaxID=235627 RepID=UPI000CFCF824|nr:MULTISPECIES: VOC family protein [unclassified Arthrobacter]PRA06899.1 glyoxalase [Arthrobacter sp. MYb229]PRA14039.1 glyoxalase [Arthrobacter sp. MYb221]PRB47847.1 glyoxalase [Arthrobacter sp. MYb216]PRC06606.1 glyoxalase [Arthrobacter sp. MYb211]